MGPLVDVFDSYYSTINEPTGRKEPKASYFKSIDWDGTSVAIGAGMSSARRSSARDASPNGLQGLAEGAVFRDPFTQDDKVTSTGDLYCTKERLRNNLQPNAFSRGWALRKGVVVLIRLSISLCNVGWLCPRPRIHQIRGGLFRLPSHVQISLVLITGLPFLPYAKMFVCERCLAKNAEEP